jgi:LPXTG-motif cell wall-anchored protein
VKKTLAAASALTLGAAGAVAGIALPAHADVTTPCGDVLDHVPSSDGSYETNWYMDCVPQYGLGKVQFEIESATGFPAGFDLSDTTITSATSDQTGGVGGYFIDPPQLPGLSVLNLDNAEATTQLYDGRVYFKQTGVQSLPLTSFPEACDPGFDTYLQAYAISYAANTIHFSTTVGGVTKKYDVTTPPVTLQLFLNLDGSGQFNPDEPQCATNGTDTLFAEGDGSPLFDQIVTTHGSNNGAGFSSLSPFPLAAIISIEGSDVAIEAPADLGSFAEVKQLAATGSDSTSLLGLGGLAAAMLAAGAAAVAFMRRRVGVQRG